MQRSKYISGLRWTLASVLVLSLLWTTPVAAGDEPQEEVDGEPFEQDDAAPGPADAPDVPDDEWLEDDDDEPDEEVLLPGAALEPPEDADEDLIRHLDSYRDSYERYAETIDVYRGALKNLVETEFERRMAEISEAFDPRIREAMAIEESRRDEAIKSLQAFIDQYPDDAEHTPDALFRLAILYDQQEEHELEQARAEYFEQLDEAEEDPDLDREDVGPMPERDFERSRATFEQLIDDWPDYHGLDLAYYFMAHMKWEEGDWYRASEYARELIDHAPDSEFVAHAWLMVGEFYFEEAGRDGPEYIRDNLKEALEAFEVAASDLGRNQLGDDNYVRAVYSWAWTHYRLENFPKALGSFRQVVAKIDELSERTGVTRDELRDDAIGHLAEILAMEDWDLDGTGAADGDLDQVDPIEHTVMARVDEYLSDGEPYERDVLAQLGDRLVEFLRFEEAIEVFEHVLQLDPLHPDNPQIHGQIVASLHRDYREEEAFAVRREMGEHYGEESAWYEHQQRTGNEGAIREAENMVRDYLLIAGTWYHDQAQTKRNEAMVQQDESLLAVAEQTYARAADAYEDFLRNYPEDPEVFQYTYYYAEALYFAGQYADAYEQYRVVREMDIDDNPFQEVSAYNAVQALEFMMRSKVEEGELTPTALSGADMDEARDAADDVARQRELEGEDALEQVEVDGEPIPAIVKDYVTALDRYVVLGLENEEDDYLDARFAFRAAQVYHDFRHFDESRTRFAWVVDQYPEHEVAYLAGSLILESFRQENDFESLTEWAEKLGDVIEGEQAEAVQAEVREFQLQGMFHAAEDMLREEDYEAAAEEFVRLAREAPDHPLAPQALNNAATVYELNGEFDRAIEQYEQLFREYPDHDLAPRAVYRVAVTSEYLFNYDKSVRHYELFYEEFDQPTPEALEALNFDIDESREDSLLQAAQMNEYLQRYDEAANRFEEYFDTYPESEFAADTLWAAAGAWERAEEHDEMVRVLNQYIDEFGDEMDHGGRKIEAWSRIADLHEERGEQVQADDLYEQILETVDEWVADEQMPPGESDIRAAAAEAQFILVERDFEDWDDIVIEGPVNQQRARTEDRLEGMDKLLDGYERVMEYDALEWNMAAYFRIANTLHRMAEALFAIPNPFEEGSEEYWVYQDQMDERAFPLEDQAIAGYEATIEAARDNQIVNEWTEQALAEMHEFDADGYPYFEDEQRPRREMIDYGVPMLNEAMHEQRMERDDITDDDDLQFDLEEEQEIDDEEGEDDEGDES